MNRRKNILKYNVIEVGWGTHTRVLHKRFKSLQN